MSIWIIYNRTLKIEKINILVKKLHVCALKMGVDAKLFASDEILAYYDENARPAILTKINLPIPEKVIFWDKDIILAKHLEKMGIQVFNSAVAIELCDNKALMTTALADTGLPLPRTIISPKVFEGGVLDEDYARGVVSILGQELVIKEAYGSFGMQVYRANGAEDLFKKICILKDRPFVVQEYIESSANRDIRVNIIGSEIVGAMLRENTDDFRANITLGASASMIELTDEQKDLALRVHKILGLDFSGVDLLFGKNENALLCEVNSNVNFLSFEEVSGVDFAGKLLEYVVKS